MPSFLTAGQYIAQLAILDDDGYPMGTLVTPNAPVNGTVYSPYLIPAVVSFTPGQATFDSVQSFAAQQLRGEIDLGLTDLGIGTLEISETDDIFEPLVNGSTLDTATATGQRIRARNAARSQARNFMLALTRKAAPQDSTPMFDTFFLLNVTFRQPGASTSQATGRNPNNRAYEVVQRMGLRTPWGQLLSASPLAVDGNKDSEIAWYSTAPIMFATYVDDASGTSVVLPYAPDSTEHAGENNVFFKQGVTNHSNVSGISGATLTVTAGSAGDRWGIFVPSSAAL